MRGYTDMAAQGMVNLGQLAREDFGQENVFSVGFGSYKGSVIASGSWGATVKKMSVPPAAANTWEGYLHSLGGTNKLMFSDELISNESLLKPVAHRAIGVVYDPHDEKGNWVPSIIPGRYDAFIYIDQTSAVHPLSLQPRNEPPDTYPSGY